jgi:hypothetical protein
LREIREKGFVATITVPIEKPGAYQMRVALRDATSARLGSANQFIEVPNLKKNRLALSGVVIRRFNPTAATAAQKPFQSDEERDSAMRRFHPGDTLKFDWSIYNAKTGKSAKPNLVIQYKIYKDDKQFFATSEKPVNISQQSSFGVIDKSEAFTLGKKIPAGNYVLQVIVKDLQANEKNQVAAQWTDFEIVP